MDLSRLAGKILERVRDFRSNFPEWQEAALAWAKPKSKTAKPARKEKKVYHRQPSKMAAAQNSKKPRRSTSKAKSSRGRKTVKK